MDETTEEKYMRGELALMLGNATAARAALVGYHHPFESFTEMLDEDPALTRRVLVRAGWFPIENGFWAIGKGKNPLSRGVDIDALSMGFEMILDQYRPLDDSAVRAA